MGTRPEEERQELGRRIKKARRLRDRTLDSLAKEAETTRQHLIRLERGDHWPADDLLERIAVALGFPLEFFVGDLAEAAVKEHRQRIAAAFETIADELLALAKLEVAKGQAVAPDEAAVA